MKAYALRVNSTGIAPAYRIFLQQGALLTQAALQGTAGMLGETQVLTS